MKAYDTIHKKELEVDTAELIRLMQQENRQVDLILAASETDGDGYLTWDREHWTSLDAKRFIRCYSFEGRQLRDSTTHNIYDIKHDFDPAKAKEIQIC